MKKYLISIIIGLALAATTAFGATILTTDSSDSLNTFRTNVNTSLTNLNDDLTATSTSIGSIGSIATSTGNLIIGDGSAWSGFTVGSDGKILMSSSTASNGLSWESALISLNGLSTANQTFSVGGNGLGISSSGSVHTFSLPQGLMSTSSPTFDSLTLTNDITLGGKVSSGPLTVSGSATSTITSDGTTSTIGGDLTISGGDLTLVDGGTTGIGGAKWTFDDTNDDISTAGNVGIGTTEPSSALDVNGNFEVSGTSDFSGTSTFSNLVLFTSNASSTGTFKVSAPSADNDAATKSYVDSAVAGGGTSADTSTAGIGIFSTLAQLQAGTATSSYDGTDYYLFPWNKYFNTTSTATTTVPVTGTDGKLSNGFFDFTKDDITLSTTTIDSDGTLTVNGDTSFGGSTSFSEPLSGQITLTVTSTAGSNIPDRAPVWLSTSTFTHVMASTSIKGTSANIGDDTDHKLAQSISTDSGFVNNNAARRADNVIVRVRKSTSTAISDNLKVTINKGGASPPGDTFVASTTISSGSLSTTYQRVTVSPKLYTTSTIWVVVERTGSQDSSKYYQWDAEPTDDRLDADDCYTYDGSSWSSRGSTTDCHVQVTFTAEKNKVYIGTATSTPWSNFNGFSVGKVSQDGDDVKMAVDGTLNGFSGLSQGLDYYLANTSLDPSSSAGNVSVEVGTAMSSTTMLINN